MNIVPIAFAFDNNLVMPASIAISSLLMNAHPDTFYDIFILHSAKVCLDKKTLDLIPQSYKQCQITYKEVDDTFDSAFEIRGVTTATYYRLLIPELIPKYDKIIYADVDMIFRLDFSEIYQIDMKDNYLAATYDLGMNLGKDGQKYINSVEGLSQGDYIQAGFIMLNNRAILADNLITEFKNQAKKKLKYQDQDILNLVCGKKKIILPWKYNMTDYSFYYLINEPESLTSKYANSDIEEAKRQGNLHFNGHKPWKKYSVNFDIWWEYYRKSPFYDERFYFDFFYNKLNELDQLPLMKRIKILVRYFVFGKRKV
mgnify:CR=1 FL=1